MTRLLISLSATLLLLTACGSDDADDAQPASDQARTASTSDLGDPGRVDLFDRIDADSAYVMANLAVLPDDLSDLFWEPLDAMGEFQADTYDQMAEDINEESPLAAALARELGAIKSRADFEARGLASNGYWAVHAVSLYPILHWQLIDPEAFEAMLERVASDADTELTRRQVGDQELVWVDMDDELSVAIHHDQQVLTIALVPDNEMLLRRVANLDQPATAFDPRTLETFNKPRGFSPHGSGFIDFKRVVGILLDQDDELAASMRAAAGLESLATEPSCRTEMVALTDQLPRFSAGLTRVDREEVSMMGRIETAPALGERLAAIADTPVAVETPNPTMLAAGMAINILAARDFARELVAGWVEKPPECPAFASIREDAGEWQASLNRPIPPFVTNIHGLQLNLDDLAMSAQGQVDKASGTLAVFMRNPQMLLGMAQMFSPELAELDLRPGGEPQPLPSGMIPNMPGLEAWMALGTEAIGMAVGEGQKDRLNSALEPGEGDSAIFGYSFNIAAYSEIATQMLGQADGLEGDSSFEFLSVLGENYTDSRFAIRLTPAGIDFVTASALAQ